MSTYRGHSDRVAQSATKTKRQQLRILEQIGNGSIAGSVGSLRDNGESRAQQPNEEQEEKSDGTERERRSGIKQEKFNQITGRPF